MMKNSIAALLCLLVSPPALASELTVPAVAGGDLSMAVGVGYGNWLTSSIWNEGIVPTDERRLESFSILVAPTDSADPLTYRMGVGVLDDRGRWAGDVYSTDLMTSAEAGMVTAQIPGGLLLDPTVNYLAYVVPDDPGWMYQTTLTNIGPGVVGIAIQFYTSSKVVDLDLPHDRDVAMHATFTSVPEPNILLLLGVGLSVLMLRRRS
jgi:hypothetical protein